MTPFQENSTPSGNKSRPYIYPPICPCGAKKDRRSERCKDCQFVFDKRPRRDEDLNIYIVQGERCRKVPLTNSQWAIVSEIDYPELIRHNWTAWWNADTQSYYAVRGQKRGGKRYTILMHNAVYIGEAKEQHFWL